MNLQEYIPPVIYELTLRSRRLGSLALAKAVLATVGCPHESIVEGEIKPYFELKIFAENFDRITRLEGLFRNLKIKFLAIRVKILRPDDWLTRWKKTWRPARLTKKLDVVPVWYKDKYRVQPKRDYILMDTLLSFGTGLHETTRFMAQMIEDCRGQFHSLLDIGTGTGILAIVALKHGAKDVLAVDIGSLSVQAARDNRAANGVDFKIQKADIARWQQKKKYDFVAANLITHDLISYKENIVRCIKGKGLLAVSGISLEHLRGLRTAFGQLPLHCLKIKKGKQWAALLYQKKMS